MVLIFDKRRDCNCHHVSTRNFLVLKTERGRSRQSSQHPVWLVEVIEVVRRSPAVGDRESGTLAASCSANPLNVVEGLRRHVAKEYDVEIAEVDAKFERS